LTMPRLVIPMGEPRVLASATASEMLPGMVHVNYTIENPSLHFLTFNLTMEASEHFAFSGPKTTVIQLVPLSRHTVRYNLLAFKRGLWIQPQLAVVDTYFNKTLRALPTERMRADKKGILVWVGLDG
jgi:trafficking protein particle complex subunit 11